MTSIGVGIIMRRRQVVRIDINVEEVRLHRQHRHKARGRDRSHRRRPSGLHRSTPAVGLVEVEVGGEIAAEHAEHPEHRQTPSVPKSKPAMPPQIVCLRSRMKPFFFIVALDIGADTLEPEAGRDMGRSVSGRPARRSRRPGSRRCRCSSARRSAWRCSNVPVVWCQTSWAPVMPAANSKEPTPTPEVKSSCTRSIAVVALRSQVKKPALSGPSRSKSSSSVDCQSLGITTGMPSVLAPVAVTTLTWTSVFPSAVPLKRSWSASPFGPRSASTASRP